MRAQPHKSWKKLSIKSDESLNQFCYTCKNISNMRCLRNTWVPNWMTSDSNFLQIASYNFFLFFFPLTHMIMMMMTNKQTEEKKNNFLNQCAFDSSNFLYFSTFILTDTFLPVITHVQVQTTVKIKRGKKIDRFGHKKRFLWCLTGEYRLFFSIIFFLFSTRIFNKRKKKRNIFEEVCSMVIVNFMCE